MEIFMKETRDIINNIIEEQRLVMTIQDDISLTTKTEVKEQEDIQKAWPKSVTYKDRLLFDQYNVAFRQAIKELDLDKTRVETRKLDEDGMFKTAYPEADREMSTSEDNDPEDIVANRVRISGDIKYFAYVPEVDRFVLGFDMKETSSVGKSNQRSVALLTCEFRFKDDYESDSKIIVEKTDRINVTYESNLDYIENKVKVEYKGKDVIIIFAKYNEFQDDIYN
jgi:hypothetical protein